MILIDAVTIDTGRLLYELFRHHGRELHRETVSVMEIRSRQSEPPKSRLNPLFFETPWLK